MIDLPYLLRRIAHRLRGRVVHLEPRGTSRGNVLISYTTLPFLNPDPRVLEGHTNRWECAHIAKSFADRGYAVDVIDAHDTQFVPKKPYRYFLDVETNLGHIAPLLNPDCVKIFHVSMRHWRANNTAEQARLDDFARRRGLKPQPERMVKPNESTEKADLLLLLGNAETERTYAHVQKPIFRIPISTTFTYPAPEDKDFSAVRHSFVWLGGGGPIHKGVDLLIEAFAAMPECHLHLCGKFADPVFLRAYEKELALPNISAHSVMDLGGDAFTKIANSSLAVLSASCAEGQAGATVVGMHAGLIPIVSKESGIDTHDFGITLPATTVETIRRAVRALAEEPADRLRERALATWNYARARHTRERFAEVWKEFVDKLESGEWRAHN